MESRYISLMFFLAAFFSLRPDYNKFSFGFVCKERERQALLSFREDLKYFDENIGNISYEKNVLSTWDGKECCNWTGVFCSPKTGNVVELHLHDLSLGGNLSPSLVELKNLNYLNLSRNHFNGIQIPSFLGSLPNLRYLDLHGAGFGGIIPQEIGNLSNIHFLDIGGNYQLYVGDFQWLSHLSSLRHLDISSTYVLPASLAELRFAFHLNSSNIHFLDISHNDQLDVGDLQWLSHLSSLKHLDMSGLDLSKVTHKWLHVINTLPSLVELRLADCYLHSSIVPTLPHINFTSLSILDLSGNKMNSSLLPAWLYNLTRLEELDLSYNNFHGTISKDVGYLTSIKILDLSYNYELEGEIPNALGNLCNLQVLNLGSNKLHGDISGFLVNSSRCITSCLKSLEYLSLKDNSFSGSIPSSLGRSSFLRVLDLGGNGLNGSLPETIGHLSNLETLVVSDNELQGVVTEANFVNLRRLTELKITSVELKLSSTWKPPFQLKLLSFRNCHIGSRFPQWLKSQKNLTIIDLSNTRISGTVPTWFWDISSGVYSLNLAHNRLTGEFTKLWKFSYPFVKVNLSFNHFNGPVPCLSSVGLLDLSHNSLSGPICSFRCHLKVGNLLFFLDLSNNPLFGEIPECLFHSSNLAVLKLESSNLTGKIPSSIGSLVVLESLRLRNNSLSGELPQSLQNCTILEIIDFGENKFSGSISTWLGANFAKLIVLRLRVNKFDGGIPEALCNLTSLQILDIAHNNLSGSIPRCFSNLSAMALKQETMNYFGISLNGDYYETASLVTKGIQYEYGNTLTLVTIMDLSTNNLTGEIPQDLTSLHELRFLNLSENRFTGKIPDKIGKMGTLESLDFSSNKLSGVIPQSIIDLHYLNYLNLSNNNLSGKIPSSTQLQSFTELSYVGNPELCGIPLKNCNDDEQAQPPGYGEGKQDDDYDGEEDVWLEMKWFYISAGLGFVTGFWGFCGVLLWKQSWRHAYFGFITSITQKLFKFCTW